MLLARKERVQFATLLYQSHLTLRNIRPITARRLLWAGFEAWRVVEELVCTGLEVTEVHRFGEEL